MLEKKLKVIDRLWEDTIDPTIEKVYSAMSQDFIDCCGVRHNDKNELKKRVIAEYKQLKTQLKKECYGANSGTLDSKKLGAIVCKSLIKEKAYTFSLVEAKELVKEKKERLSSVEFNSWMVDNIFANYKLAYVASTFVVYSALAYCYKNKKCMTVDEKYFADGDVCYEKLLDAGRLAQYPEWKGFDSFGANVVIALARADTAGRELDLFLFSLLLWQTEMYTMELLSKSDWI